MKKMAVVGTPEFTLGFKMTGIREVINVKDPNNDVKLFFSRDDIGIVIIDEDTVSKLDERTKEELITSITPVFVTVSTTSAQEELRNMIMQSIGVDLMKNES